MTFIWMYFLDVITSPVAWMAFGLGCMFTAVCALAAAWFAGRWARIQRARVSAVRIVPVSDEWACRDLANQWFNVTRRSIFTPFCMSTTNHLTGHTETSALTDDQARSLATWILNHLRGVPK